MHFDLIVIGSGPGGYRASVLAAEAGMKVGIVERGEWGGCAVNRGCVPKNDWHHTAKLIAGTRGRRGIPGNIIGDLAQAWEHQRKLVRQVRDAHIGQMKRLGIAGFVGHAAFADPNTIVLDGRDALSARHVVIATGSTPYVPKPFFLTPQRVLTSDELFTASPPPGQKVALVGSGAVATEFAFILAMFGREVAWLSDKRPLANSGFSREARASLLDRLQRLGISPPVGGRPQAVEMTEAGVRLILADGRDVVADWVLLGTGRRPYTSGLNLDAAGVATDSRGFVKTNEMQQTSQPHIYAVGDVAHARMSASLAVMDASVAVAHMLDPSKPVFRPPVPECIRSALELARIGAALEEGVGRIVVRGFENNARAMSQGEGEGFVRLELEAGGGCRLLGAEVVGGEACDLIHILAQGLQNGGMERLASGLAAYGQHLEEVYDAARQLRAEAAAKGVAGKRERE